MSRDKQIEEMAKIMTEKPSCIGLPCSLCEFNGKPPCMERFKARYLYEEGYRKASDVAEEIFAEIGVLVNEYLDGRSYKHEFLTKIVEVKKKYIGKDTNVTTNTEDGE